jgi:hypothetical protein
MITNGFLINGAIVVGLLIALLAVVFTLAFVDVGLANRCGVRFIRLPQLSAISLAYVFYFNVDPAWFEAAGKVGSPEFSRAALILKAVGIAIGALLVARNFWRAPFLVAIGGTALQVVTAYLFGQAMVVMVGLVLASLIFGAGSAFVPTSSPTQTVYINRTDYNSSPPF